VEDKKLSYVNSKRLDKPLVALEIIKSWRAQDPPGRFLKFSEKTGLWEDVGDKKAREKTSQALRERAPEIRRKQEEEEEAAKHENEGDSGEVRMSADYNLIQRIRLLVAFLNSQCVVNRTSRKRSQLASQTEPATRE